MPWLPTSANAVNIVAAFKTTYKASNEGLVELSLSSASVVKKTFQYKTPTSASSVLCRVSHVNFALDK